MSKCIRYFDIPMSLRGQTAQNLSIDELTYRMPYKATLTKSVFDWCQINGVTYIKKLTSIEYFHPDNTSFKSTKTLELEFRDERQAALFRLRWLTV